MSVDPTVPEPASPLVRQILATEPIRKRYVEARDRVEAAYHAANPPPPEPPPMPRPLGPGNPLGTAAHLTPEGREWFRLLQARMDHFHHALDLAKQDPEVEAIRLEHDTLVDAIWARVDAIGHRVGAVPGLAPCPACDGTGYSIPQPLRDDHRRSGSLAACADHEDHIIRWMPWGG